MSYKNFVPRIWSNKIQTELVRESVFAADCNREYEGAVKECGDSVRILGVGKPTINHQVGGKVKLESPEEVQSSSTTLYVNEIAYFNFGVGDIDRAQSKNDVMRTLMQESTEGLANQVDMSIAKLAADKTAKKLAGAEAGVELTADNVLDYVDQCILALLENDVKRSTKIFATVPPWFWMLVKNKLTSVDTDNSGRIRTLDIGNYGNVQFRCSNNVAVNGGLSLPMFRTKGAIAAVQPLTHVEPYRPEAGFEDAVKGYTLYGQKIVRPKELIVLPCKRKA